MAIQNSNCFTGERLAIAFDFIWKVLLSDKNFAAFLDPPLMAFNFIKFRDFKFVEFYNFFSIKFVEFRSFLGATDNCLKIYEFTHVMMKVCVNLAALSADRPDP